MKERAAAALISGGSSGLEERGGGCWALARARPLLLVISMRIVTCAANDGRLFRAEESGP